MTDAKGRETMPGPSRFYDINPDDPESPKLLDQHDGQHHGTIRPGDRVVYDCPEAPHRGSPAPDGTPLVVAEIIDFGGGAPVQAVLNDGQYECGADNLRRDGCPDGGGCHHECGDRPCFRVICCGPLSGVYPGDDWPADVKAANPPDAEPDPSEPDDHDPGPEVDDQGGMSEHQYAITPEELA